MSEDWQSWAKDLLLGIEYCGLARNYASWLMWQNPKLPRFASVFWRSKKDPGAMVKRERSE